MNIPASKASLVGKELKNIKSVLTSGKLSAGFYTARCTRLLEKLHNAKKIFLTTSGTHALEMASHLVGLEPGDEVVLPAFTFVSTANVFATRLIRPVFVDIRPDTLNIDERIIERALSSRTKAIVPVHYAGVGAEMDAIRRIAQKHRLYVIEDAAQGWNATYKNKSLGTLGDLGFYSFNHDKNFTCGQGGALVINNKKFFTRSEIVIDNGTNRAQFLRGEVDHYEWIDIGSRYQISEILAAFLYGQLEKHQQITEKRKKLYDYYYKNLVPLAKKECLRLPVIPRSCRSNGHIFYMLMENNKSREALRKDLNQHGIQATFHFVSLHSSPMGRKLGYRPGDFPITESVCDTLLRLPMYYTLTNKLQDHVIDRIYRYFDEKRPRN